MTTSNEASGAAPDVSSVDSAEPAKAPTRARKTAAPKKTPSAKSTAAKTAKKAPVKASAAAEAAAPATDEAKPAAKAPKKAAPRKSAPKKAAAKATAPAEKVEASEAVAAPAKAASPKKPRAKAPARPADEKGKADDAPAPKADEAPASEAAPAAAPEEKAEKSSSQRRKRGSRGRGKSSAAKAEAALALEGQDAKALPAPPEQIALPGEEPKEALPPGKEPVAIESAEAQKKSRRRKRGKGGNGSNGSNGSNGEAKAENAQPAPKAEAPAPAPKAARGKGKRKMFVSVLAGEQVEVVLSEEGQIREYYVEMLHQAKVKGNIYKGVIHNVDPNLQAAFVSYGAVKNGFLQIDEVHPEYYLTPHEQGKGHKYPLIQKVLKAGQEILVQVVKEPSGTKGAFLTSYISIPGRYLVLTPGREQIGVSRKVGNDTERGRLREILEGLTPGEGLGVIVRTVSEGASKTNLQRDLQFLKRVWRDVRKKGSTEESPALIYQELGLAARAVRDYLTDDVIELWVDDKNMAEEMSEVITMLFPKRKSILHLHDDSSQSLFERFGLSKQIAQVQGREVVLPSGGRLVFDQTEALMAIDINSGRTGGKSNFEEMAYKINLEAAQHIPLQLRLRDIGGQIVVDFIEMRDRAHWREVEKAFRNGMKEDRARHDVGKISSFGLLEVVRQRLGSSAISIASEPCPFCKGTGVRRNMEWQAMQAMQEIQQLVRQNSEEGKTITYTGAAELVFYILNRKKEWLLDMEQDNNIKLELHSGL